jgi:hypothetical protein
MPSGLMQPSSLQSCSPALPILLHRERAIQGIGFLEIYPVVVGSLSTLLAGASRGCLKSSEPASS